MQLTLVTLNTCKGEGDYPVRLLAVGDLIADLHPDIVFLQEVFAGPLRQEDRKRPRKSRLGLQIAHVSPSPQDGGPSCIDYILCVPRGVKFIEISHQGDATTSDHLAVRAVINLGE